MIGVIDASNLDRKDSVKPYTLDNVVVCCWRCNKVKNTTFTYTEWLELGQVIKSWGLLAELELNLEKTSGDPSEGEVPKRQDPTHQFQVSSLHKR